MLTVLLAAAASVPEVRAVECNNGGIGPNPAGDDNGQTFNTACGNSAVASGDFSTAIGNVSTASGDSSSAYGSGSTASETSSSAYGAQSAASGDSSSAFGVLSEASGVESSAYGFDSLASGDSSSAFGSGSVSFNTNSSAFGSGSVSSGVDSSAFGSGSTASNTRSSAFGAQSTASGASSVAIGAGATVNVGHTNSTAIGAGAQTTRANQVALGTSASTYTMAGLTSNASKTAQGAPTHVVISNANGDLAAYTFSELGLASAADLDAVNAQVKRNSTRIGENTEGVAMAIAMAGSYLPQPGETFRFSGNWGNFEGENALAFNGAYALGRRTYLTAGFGAGLSEGTFGGRAGFSFGW